MSRYLVRAAPLAHFAWIMARAGCSPTPQARAIEAVDGAGNIRGMVLYDAWTDNSVQLHIAVDSPMAWRSLLRPGLEYPFLQAKRGVCVGLISALNRASCRFAERVGFTQIGRIRDGLKVGEDLILYQLRREDCRHLRQERKAA